MGQKEELSLEGLYKKIGSIEERLQKLESGSTTTVQVDLPEESYPQLPGMNLEVSGSLLESKIGYCHVNQHNQCNS